MCVYVYYILYVLGSGHRSSFLRLSPNVFLIAILRHITNKSFIILEYTTTEKYHIKSYIKPLSQRRRARRENIDWFLTKNTDPSFASSAPLREHKSLNLQHRLDKNKQQLSDQV